MVYVCLMRMINHLCIKLNCRNYKKTNKSYCTKHIENKDLLEMFKDFLNLK